MQTVKITMELTLEQVRNLFSPYKQAVTAKKISSDDLKSVIDEVEGELVKLFKPGQGRGSEPYVDNARQYRAEGGEGQPHRGRPNALTVDGMRLVWKLYNQGYSIREIGGSFSEVASVDTIRRLIAKISKAGVKP